MERTVLLFFALVENPPDDKKIRIEQHKAFKFGMLGGSKEGDVQITVKNGLDEEIFIRTVPFTVEELVTMALDGKL